MHYAVCDPVHPASLKSTLPTQIGLRPSVPEISWRGLPETYCQVCSHRKKERVGLLEMKKYAEIDPNETPTIILGCGHCLTAGSLDGHTGMADVYKQALNGECTALKDMSTSLAHSISL